MNSVNAISLYELARKSREFSYSPYSGYSVGAALLCSDGEIYTGCNIENAAFSPTVCAERVAFFKALSEGKRNFQAIAVAGGKSQCGFCTPCGVCRQVMAEFCDPDEFEVVYMGTQDIECMKLKDFLPLGFGTENVGECGMRGDVLK